jgi:hypothetical protein
MIDFTYYDREGNPLESIQEYGKLHQDEDYKIVAKTTVGQYEVSTVWLGMNHQYDEGPPLIFETMIFGGDRDGELWNRYPTETHAIVGHDQAVAHLEK